MSWGRMRVADPTRVMGWRCGGGWCCAAGSSGGWGGAVLVVGFVPRKCWGMGVVLWWWLVLCFRKHWGMGCAVVVVVSGILCCGEECRTTGVGMRMVGCRVVVTFGKGWTVGEDCYAVVWNIGVLSSSWCVIEASWGAL